MYQLFTHYLPTIICVIYVDVYCLFLFLLYFCFSHFFSLCMCFFLAFATFDVCLCWCNRSLFFNRKKTKNWGCNNTKTTWLFANFQIFTWPTPKIQPVLLENKETLLFLFKTKVCSIRPLLQPIRRFFMAILTKTSRTKKNCFNSLHKLHADWQIFWAIYLYQINDEVQNDQAEYILCFFHFHNATSPW